ncbi:hypothetical protein DLAC_07325 [Tieghemostelium lacteum]|uniref:LUD domain-containing protein n=1 Tax=Tieghemostelium lacteum TaxID=361077 RepID=A0A151ZC90_TIELA|nr:hypothetical protein DLAC_07325 [Tieghemostelium lacteum]|eukprot:KYQ91558.1 hypothetical protein DLAC_07325 [Tieghemostelium lacteum]
MSYTFEQLSELESDFLSKVDVKKFRSTPSEQLIKDCIAALEAKKHKVTVVDDEAAALEAVKKLIPDGASVMQASSMTFDEIGFKKVYQSEDSKWISFHKKIFAEKDPSKQGDIRREALTADYFLSSVTAISKSGNFFVADASGTRVGGFTAGKNVVLVAGINKLTESDEDAIKRTNDFCLPSESVRARKAYGVPGSQIQNLLKVAAERSFHIILVRKLLGY